MEDQGRLSILGMITSNIKNNHLLFLIYFSIRGGVRHLLFFLVPGFHSSSFNFLFSPLRFFVLGPGLGSDFVLFYGIYPCWVVLRPVLPFLFPPPHFSSSRLPWPLRDKNEKAFLFPFPFTLYAHSSRSVVSSRCR